MFDFLDSINSSFQNSKFSVLIFLSFFVMICVPVFCFLIMSRRISVISFFWFSVVISFCFTSVVFDSCHVNHFSVTMTNSPDYVFYNLSDIGCRKSLKCRVTASFPTPKNISVLSFTRNINSLSVAIVRSIDPPMWHFSDIRNVNHFIVTITDFPVFVRIGTYKFNSRVSTPRISGNNIKLSFSVIFCVIAALLDILLKLPFRVVNYRRCETPKRVLIKRSRSRSYQSMRLLTLITFLSFVTITFNESAVLKDSTEPYISFPLSVTLFNNTISIYINCKGKPLRLSYIMTLMLAGDINPNPGPAKITCNNCFRTIAKNHRYVSCIDCLSSSHIKCAGVSPSYYNRLQVDNNHISFTCQSCISDSLPFANVDPTDEADDDFVMPDHIKRLDLFKKSCLNIAHLNINGLRSKLDFIKILLSQEKFDILCLNETKIDSTVSDSDLSVPGYLSYRQDRTLHGGGTMIYCSENLKIQIENSAQLYSETRLIGNT